MTENATGTPLLVSPDAVTKLVRRTDLPERWLQEQIHRHPSCLPMDQIEPGIGRLIPVCMELPLSVGPVDNLLLTPEGNVVMVEVKLWSNPEARRKVVAQALDYATGLFQLDYDGLQAAVMKGDFGGAARPDRLYDLVDGADGLSEKIFVDRINHNLREGRIVVLIVGDGIRTDAEALVTGLQAHANFHFTFALVEMPVYVRPQPESHDEFIVIPQTLVKTVTVPRFTIRTTGGAMAVQDTGMDEREATKPSRRTNISSEEFFGAMESLAPNLPEKLKKFLDEIDTIDVRPEFFRSLNLYWDQPQGKPVNLGYIPTNGKVLTDASYWQVDSDLAEDYNLALAKLFDGEVRVVRKKKDGEEDRSVTRRDGTSFRIEEVMDRLSGWPELMEDFQNAIRSRAQERDRVDPRSERAAGRTHLRPTTAATQQVLQS